LTASAWPVEVDISQRVVQAEGHAVIQDQPSSDSIRP